MGRGVGREVREKKKGLGDMKRKREGELGRVRVKEGRDETFLTPFPSSHQSRALSLHVTRPSPSRSSPSASFLPPLLSPLSRPYPPRLQHCELIYDLRPAHQCYC